jgi:hypothetical protein
MDVARQCCKRGSSAVGVGLRSVKGLDGYGTRLCPPSLIQHHHRHRRSPLSNESTRLLSAMGLSVSRLLSGLFGKKEMRASFNCRFLPCHPTCSILTCFLGILMVNARLLAARK